MVSFRSKNITEIVIQKICICNQNFDNIFLNVIQNSVGEIKLASRELSILQNI